ncbi:cupin domain-containing protein [Malonomonas rubra]|uniref:cupin domain-containing protein n=1 Tax=Malonomonas rubra TaxID=57040 RepID=UPI0026F372B9|nr:cupin domain-containing protein [Malonomonas rubra]
MHPRAQQLIEQLQLQPHPEGGYFREVYRSPLQVHSAAVEGTRSAVTDIYFLLPAGQISRWHRVLHDELWNFYEGAPMKLHQLSPDLSSCHCSRLDPQALSFKQLVPGGFWQAAESCGDYSLVGCCVAPGFEFADFLMLKELPEAVAKVYAYYPEVGQLI